MRVLYLLSRSVDEASKAADTKVFTALSFVAALVLVLLLGAAFIHWHTNFKRELRRVNQRIAQSINERERRHYIRRRRRLYLSIIPFVKYKR